MYNLMEKAGQAYEKGNYKKALGYLLRLGELKMDLIWKLDISKPVSSLCVAKYIKPWGIINQIIIGSEDKTVYSLSLDKEVRWKFKAKDKITSVAAYDVTNNLSEEIIVGSKDHYVYILDKEGRLLWKYLTEDPINCITATEIKGKKVIIAGSSKGTIYFIDYGIGLFWKYTHKNPRPIKGLCIANLIREGEKELVSVNEDGEVIILDYQKQALKNLFKLGNSPNEILAKDIDNDGSDEIIICFEDARVCCLDTEGQLKWHFQTKGPVYCVSSCDVSHNNEPEILVGTRDNFVYVIDSQGNFKWRYQTDYNVTNISCLSPAHVSPADCYDLFFGLSNHKICYYRLVDKKKIHLIIEKYYLSLLNSTQDELTLLENLSQEQDEYFRMFSVQSIAKFAHDDILRPRVFNCLERLMKDTSPLVRSASIEIFIKLTNYRSRMVDILVESFSSEGNEDVRKILIKNIIQDYLQPIGIDKQKELLECLQALNNQWKRQDFILRYNVFDHAKEEFFIGNYKEALSDFELLKKRGADLIWKTKIEGHVCSIVTADIEADGYDEIVVTSSSNRLYVLKYTGQIRWEKELEMGEGKNWVIVEDINGDGLLEIIVGCSNGTFFLFTPDGQKRGQILLKEGINSFALFLTKDSYKKKIVYECVNGFLHCIDLSGRKIWKFPTGSHDLKIDIKDIDGDNFQEVIAASPDGHVFVLDSKGKIKWSFEVKETIESLIVTDFENKRKPVIILGTKNGRIYTCENKGKPKLIKDVGSTISGIYLDKGKKNGQKNIIVATRSDDVFLLDNDNLKRFYDLRLSSSLDYLVCSDIDKDGCSELAVGTKDETVYLYKIIKLEAVERYIKDCREELIRIENKIHFKRKDVFRFIREQLENDDKSFKKIFLVGDSGSGKTSLMEQINSGCLGEGYISVYINLQHMGWNNLSIFLYQLTKELLEQISHEKMEIFYKNEFEKDYKRAFNSFIKTINTYLDGQNLLILFDDFEKFQAEVNKEILSEKVFYYLDKLSEIKKSNFIIATSSKLLEKENEESFFNEALIKDVSFISRSEARLELHNYLDGQVLNLDETIENIISLTGCKAHLIEAAVEIIIKYVKTKKSKQLLSRDWPKIKGLILGSVDGELGSVGCEFTKIWDLCSSHERLLISCLSNLDPKMSFDKDIKPYIKKRLGTFACLFSQSILNETLKDLSEKFILNQFVIEDTLFYSFAIPLMREWIKDTMNDPLPVISHNSTHLLQRLPLGQFSRLDNQLKKQNKEDFLLSTLHFAENKWDNLVKFSESWSGLLEDRKKDFGQRTDKNRVNTIIQNFADLFDCSIDTIKSHALMDYCRFKTMPSVIKRLRNIVLIIPMVEKTDESFYEAMIELIIDQDDVSSVFLIIEFADSPEFIKQCGRSRLDLVLLFEKEMKEVLFSQNYLQALQEKVILKRVDLVQFSPYMINMPVEGRMFFGRQTEIKRVEHKSQKNFAIVASRQAGKTSLLRKLKSRIVAGKKVKTLYLDCEIYSDPANNMSRLCTDILKGLSLVKTSVKDINEFRSILEKNCQTKNSKIYLFLDEIDEILAEDTLNGGPLFRTFRALSQKGYVNLIIAGYYTLFKATNELHSPLFNFMEVLRLGPLDYDSAVQLITEPMLGLSIKMQNTNLIVDEICKITACYPHLIQCFCKKIVEMAAGEKRREIFESDIEQIKNDREFQDYVLRSFYQPISEMGKIIILLFINSDEFSLYDIDLKLRKYGIRLKHRELYNEAENLCMLSIFVKESKKFRFSLPYLSIILEKVMETELELQKLTGEEVCVY